MLPTLFFSVLAITIITVITCNQITYLNFVTDVLRGTVKVAKLNRDETSIDAQVSREPRAEVRGGEPPCSVAVRARAPGSSGALGRPAVGMRVGYASDRFRALGFTEQVFTPTQPQFSASRGPSWSDSTYPPGRPLCPVSSQRL